MFIAFHDRSRWEKISFAANVIWRQKRGEKNEHWTTKIDYFISSADVPCRILGALYMAIDSVCKWGHCFKSVFIYELLQGWKYWGIINILRPFWTRNMQDITYRQTPFRFTTHEGKLCSIFSINSQVVMWRSVDGISRYNLLIQLKIHSFGAQHSAIFFLMTRWKSHFWLLRNFISVV